jgi:hypothetical protein
VIVAVAERTPQSGAQHPVLVIRADRGVNRRRRRPRMADLVLHEQRIDAVFDEMGDIAVA